MRTEPHAEPALPAPRCVRHCLKSFRTITALPAKITSTLIQQTTHVRHVRSDMCKTPPTRTAPPAWFVRTARDEQANKPNVRHVPTHMSATITVSAGHAPATQYQTFCEPIVKPAPTREKASTTWCVSASEENEVPQSTAAPAWTAQPVKFQAGTDSHALTRHAPGMKSTITTATPA